MTRSARVLVVEDDPAQAEHLCRFLVSLGHDVGRATTTAAARDVLEAGGVDVVLCDLRLPDGDGLELLAWAHPRHPLADFVVLTAHGSVETAVEAMRRGAHDFLTKPIDLDLLEQRLERLLDRRRLEKEVRQLREQIGERVEVPGLVAESAGMQRVLALVRRVAPTPSTVLVTGESGTGKEVVASLLHRWSPRRAGPFVRVNCGALTETLLESELFGHARGAFTGADRDREGLFREAHGGTLFLDEIGEVSPAMQVKLLRVLQEREVTRVGESRPVAVDVRIVAATNRDLKEEVRAGRFRQDLFFRLDTIGVHVPPLRDRREDTAALVPLLLRRYAEESGLPPRRLSREAHDLLLAYPFPGNVRELQNVLYRAAVLSAEETIRAADLPESVRHPESLHDSVPRPGPHRSLPEFLREIERRAIVRALEEQGGVQARAARALGMPARVLRYKLRLHGIDPSSPVRPDG